MPPLRRCARTYATTDTSLPGRSHRTVQALPPRQRTDNRRLQLADIQVTPLALGRVVVAADRFARTVETLLPSPDRQRLLHADDHFPLRVQVIHAADSPRLAQGQDLMQDFFRNHCGTYSTPFPPSYQLQTSRNRTFAQQLADEADDGFGKVRSDFGHIAPDKAADKWDALLQKLPPRPAMFTGVTRCGEQRFLSKFPGSWNVYGE